MNNPIDYINELKGVEGDNFKFDDNIIYTRDDIIIPDSNWELISNGIIDWDNLKQKFEPDEYGNHPIIICKKTTYTQAHRKAQQKYREKFPEKYNEVQRKLYDDKKQDDEWKKKFNERSKLNNKKYREKKLQERIDAGIEIKPKGRPRKIKPEIIDVKISNIILDDGQQPDLNQEVKVEGEIILEEPKKKRTYKKKEKNTVEILV
jgi:hypothetical protein